MNISENVPLAPLTTLEVGGPARFFASVETEDEVIEAFGFARERGLPVFVLGGGSNILVSDKGFEGLVVRIALKGLSQDSPGEDMLVRAAAGENWDSFVARCVKDDLAGIECMSGIPGTIGGTPVQNVGAYGQEVSETIIAVRCFDRQAEGIVELSNEQCSFGYRTSIFNTIERERYMVLSVLYRLTPGGNAKIVYRELVDRFADRQPSLAETREAVLTIRRSKSMVIEKDDPNRRSAGSFFKNPIGETDKFKELNARFNGEVPHFPAGSGKEKIPAAWLIEKAGFQKGFEMGNVGISTNHSLAIVNRGGASAAEIVELKDAIQSAVNKKFGIELVPEPIFVGEF